MPEQILQGQLKAHYTFVEVMPQTIISTGQIYIEMRNRFPGATRPRPADGAALAARSERHRRREEQSRGSSTMSTPEQRELLERIVSAGQCGGGGGTAFEPAVFRAK